MPRFTDRLVGEFRRMVDFAIPWEDGVSDCANDTIDVSISVEFSPTFCSGAAYHLDFSLTARIGGG